MPKSSNKRKNGRPKGSQWRKKIGMARVNAGRKEISPEELREMLGNHPK